VGTGFEIRHRRVIATTDIALQGMLATLAFAPIIRRSLDEAAIAWEIALCEGDRTRSPASQ
jgi:hypothetical protein